jgi:hypothetical protein
MSAYSRIIDLSSSPHPVGTRDPNLEQMSRVEKDKA